MAQKHLRAIGCARERFSEDKLRMLRAVRFAAAFEFVLDEEVREAVVAMAPEIQVVSPERIAMEMRRLLADGRRAVGVRLLLETKLLDVLLPEIRSPEKGDLDRVLVMLPRLGESCGFPLALAALLAPFVDTVAAEAICRRWRLSNKETERVVWLVVHQASLADAQSMWWSALQPLLVADGAEDLVLLTEAATPENAPTVAYCRTRLALPRETLDPPPLLTGDDLREAGVPAGPRYKTVLQCIRNAQLDGEVRTKGEALERAKEWMG